MKQPNPRTELARLELDIARGNFRYACISQQTPDIIESLQETYKRASDNYHKLLMEDDKNETRQTGN